MKCGSTAHELKTIVLPTKKTHEAQVGVDMFYLKICCIRYTEMYSPKAIDKIRRQFLIFQNRIVKVLKRIIFWLN